MYAIKQTTTNLRVGSSVQFTRRHNVISLFRQVENRVENGIGTGRRGQTTQGMSTFQLGVAALENVRGRIHEPGINVTKLFQRKQVGRVFRIAKDVGRRTVDRNAPRGTLAETVRDGLVGRVTTVQGDSVKAGSLLVVVGHGQRMEQVFVNECKGKDSSIV